MNRKINVITALFFVGFSYFSECEERRSLSNIVANDDFPKEDSIWESNPEEIFSVTVQILDKVSGKVFSGEISKGESVRFGTITLEVKNCFKNSPEDKNEIYAFIVISEKGKIIFANWLFASSPSTNLFSHPMYDVRIEF